MSPRLWTREVRPYHEHESADCWHAAILSRLPSCRAATPSTPDRRCPQPAVCDSVHERRPAASWSRVPRRNARTVGRDRPVLAATEGRNLPSGRSSRGRFVTAMDSAKTAARLLPPRSPLIIGARRGECRNPSSSTWVARVLSRASQTPERTDQQRIQELKNARSALPAVTAATVRPAARRPGPDALTAMRLIVGHDHQ